VKRKFFGNLLLIVFLNLLIKPAWIFGIDLHVQNLVGASEYGLYFSLLSFSYLLNMLLDLGLTNFNSRFVAQNNHLVSKYFTHIFTLRMLLGLLYFAVCMVWAFLSGLGPRPIAILFFLLANQFFLSTILYLRSIISGLLLLTTDSIISIIDRSMMIILCGLLFLGQASIKIEWFVYAQTFSYFIAALVAFIVVLRKTGRLSFQIDWKVSLVLMKQCLPFALLTLLMSIYTRADGYLLSVLLPDGHYQSGLYAQSYRLFDAFTNFSLLFAGLLYPIFATQIKQKISTGEVAGFAFALIMLPALVVGTISFLFSSQIMGLLYRETTSQSAMVFTLLMLSYIAVSASYIFGTLLTANGSLKQLNIIAAGSLVLNITLNFILIPKYKATGAAISCTVTQFASVIAQAVAAKHIMKFRNDWQLLKRFLLFLISFLLLAFISSRLIYSWIYATIIICFIGLTAAFLSRVLSPRQMLGILLNSENQMEQGDSAMKTES
jgi:O-antigen/teichoic acid export membrane protein